MAIKQYKNTPYYVTDQGEVFRVVKLKPQRNRKNGYLRVRINNGKRKQYYIHRLVAELFIKDDLTNLQVNHLDKNIENNKVENLNPCTLIENIIHRDNTQDPF